MKNKLYIQRKTYFIQLLAVDVRKLKMHGENVLYNFYSKQRLGKEEITSVVTVAACEHSKLL